MPGHERPRASSAGASGRLVLAVMLNAAVLLGCSDASEAPQTTPAAGAQPDSRQARTQELFARSCVLCHATGAGGAPIVGDGATWQRLLVQGEDVLLRHTIEGYNNMPPLGYCMDCDREDFSHLIRFMAAGQ